MSYVEQEDVFQAVEPVIRGVFDEFSSRKVEDEFPHITYADAMLKYGSDKPDLRIPIEIADVTDIFAGSDFAIFAKNIEKVYFDIVSLSDTIYDGNDPGAGGDEASGNGPHGYYLQLPDNYESTSSNPNKGSGVFTNSKRLYDR